MAGLTHESAHVPLGVAQVEVGVSGRVQAVSVFARFVLDVLVDTCK